MKQVSEYIQANKDRFIEELIELLKIPSVSADSKYKGSVMDAAEVVRKSLEKAGADKTELCQTAGFPVVYAEKMIDASKPTILVYGHYDVQPADPLELWDSPPFEPVIKNGKIYARGACDDKGQMYMHVKAFELMMQTDQLPCNVKFIIEGEEEVGSANLETFISANKEKLKADIILISDTSMLSMENPSITTGLKGLSYLEVEVTGPNRDLHSGVYGGAVANPINILCEMIGSLKDENNHINIPGFYDNVLEASANERELMAKTPFNLEDYKSKLGIDEVHGEAGYTTIERKGIRPTLDVNGMWGGYTGEGAKTVLPSKASAKISMRLVPNQSDEEITEKFKKHFESIAPKSVKVQVKPHHGGEPYVMPIDIPEYKAASDAIIRAFGKEPVPVRAGGSIPIVALFEEVLGLKSILLGFGLDTDAIHSPNEHYGIENFLKGIETISYFYESYSNSK
ncbi:MAG: acetylornithine deacetylase/succinyl-diaminopimelate desuccinylase-like protein [Vicingaceae bacterium]|jgi:acetylornithine deacetylase/succinyl-diaminopimelate desuccinylase-like protein|tara:strand:- start:584 stop:1951 length:1368 start_codon:yes stop_codon:yes gene_type:complete